MKINIDIKKIKDAPIENASSVDKVKINKLKEELIRGNPTTYLVSGYRGVGKTSFIKTLINEINLELVENEIINNVVKDSIMTKFKSFFSKNKTKSLEDEAVSQKIFVHLNVGKYNGFSNILRHLIREVYWSITNNEKTFNTIYLNDSKLFSEIELIYSRTFHEVELKEVDLQSKEIVKSFVFSTDFRNLITRLSTFLLGSIGFINYIKGGHWTSYVIPLIVLVCLLIRFEYTKKKTKLKSTELNRKTFYDDEIAEFQLTRIISKLEDLGIQFIFVIDELDKIEKDEDINTFISDLKPLMLSGKSNFILIFGQKTLYKYLMSDITDNGMLSSVFSRNVHIPLLNKEDFETYFISLIGEDEYKNETVKKYLDAKILLSNRILRKFINLVRHDINYDENKETYLEIDENDKVMLTNSTISEVIYLVEKEVLQETKNKVEEGVKDFLIFNLYIAIKNMRRMQFINFGIDDILKSKDFIEDEFASVYLSYIKKNIHSLLNKMVNEQLLEIIKKDEEDSKKEDSDLDSLYKWTEKAELGSFDDSSFTFFNEYIKFEKWLLDFSYQAHKYILNIPISSKSIIQNLRSLINNSLISAAILEDFKPINNVRNNIAHGQGLNEVEKKAMITFNRDLAIMKRIIFEELMIASLHAFNPNYDQAIHSNLLKINIDALIDSVAFEFKVYQSQKNIEKYLSSIQPIDYLESIKELRILILFENDISSSLLKKIEDIQSKTNIKIKIINEIKMFEIQDFLRVNKENSGE